METFEGASLGVGITRPFADLAEDFVGFIFGHPCPLARMALAQSMQPSL
jgi:hypothetical protein